MHNHHTHNSFNVLLSFYIYNAYRYSATDHGAYRKRLLADHACSGKLTALARLLVEAGVVRRSECSSQWGTLSSLLETGFEETDELGAGFGEGDRYGDGGEEDSSSGSDNEEEEEEEEEEKKEVKEEKEEKEEQGEEEDGVGGRRRSKRLREGEITRKTNAKQKQKPHQKSSGSRVPPGDVHRCLIFAQHRAVLDLVESVVLQVS